MNGYTNSTAVSLFKALLLVSFTLTLSTNSIAADKLVKVDKTMVGLGIAITPLIYRGVDDELDPALLLDVRYGDFFARRKASIDQNITIGYDLLENDSVTLAIAVSRGGTKLETTSQDLHIGLEERKIATEAGFIGRYRSPNGLLEGGYLQDISSQHGGIHGFMKLSNPLPGNGRLQIIPAFFFTYYGAKYNRYYYEVTLEENQRAVDLSNNTNTLQQLENFRPVYSPGNSIHVGVDVYFEYELSEKMNASFYVSYEDITGEVETSPLVDDKSITHVLMGLNYLF